MGLVLARLHAGAVALIPGFDRAKAEHVLLERPDHGCRTGAVLDRHVVGEPAHNRDRQVRARARDEVDGAGNLVGDRDDRPSSARQSASGVPRKSSNTWMPAAPIAISVTPCRQGRPIVSETMTPMLPPRALRIALALASGPPAIGEPCPRGYRWNPPPPPEPERILHDAGVAAGGHDAHGLGGDGVLAVGGPHAPALGFAHDLRGDDDDVAVLNVFGYGANFAD